MANNVQKTHCKYGHELTPDNVRQTYAANGTKDGRRCLTCAAEGMKNYRKFNLEKSRLVRTNSAIKMKFGIDGITGREQLLEAQGGKCQICGTSDCSWGKGFTKKWHIDHDHKTGAVRAILCSECNTLLGQVEKNPELIDKMKDYLSQ